MLAFQAGAQAVAEAEVARAAQREGVGHDARSSEEAAPRSSGHAEEDRPLRSRFRKEECQNCPSSVLVYYSAHTVLPTVLSCTNLYQSSVIVFCSVWNVL